MRASFAHEGESQQLGAQPVESGGALPDVQVHAAAFYYTLLKGGYYDEADEFAEWYLETFDTDLET